jgi:FlaA1/EpsC-like NDP-sugar epimerase
MQDFFDSRQGEEILIWGSGRAAVNTLSQLNFRPDDYAEIRVVDGDQERVGLCLPGTGLKIQSLDSVNGQAVDNLVIASSFVEEIQREASDRDLSFRNLELIKL